MLELVYIHEEDACRGGKAFFKFFIALGKGVSLVLLKSLAPLEMGGSSAVVS